eukprot:766124-Hanusia_phi.AAC.2
MTCDSHLWKHPVELPVVDARQQMRLAEEPLPASERGREYMRTPQNPLCRSCHKPPATPAPLTHFDRFRQPVALHVHSLPPTSRASGGETSGHLGAQGEDALLQDSPVLLHPKTMERVVEGVGEVQVALEPLRSSMLEDLTSR